MSDDLLFSESVRKGTPLVDEFLITMKSCERGKVILSSSGESCATVPSSVTVTTTTPVVPVAAAPATITIGGVPITISPTTTTTPVVSTVAGTPVVTTVPTVTTPTVTQVTTTLAGTPAIISTPVIPVVTTPTVTQVTTTPTSSSTQVCIREEEDRYIVEGVKVRVFTYTGKLDFTIRDKPILPRLLVERNICGFTGLDDKYLGCDPYSNMIIVHANLQKQMSKIFQVTKTAQGTQYTLPLVRILKHYGCGSKLFMVTDSYTNEILADVGESTALSLVTQAIATLNILQDNWRYQHAEFVIDSGVGNLYLSRTGMDPIDIKSSLTFKLIPNELASATFPSKYESVRVYQYDQGVRTHFFRSAFSPIIYEDKKEIPGGYYIVNMSERDYIAFMKMGYPFYSTFDTYRVIVKLALMGDMFARIQDNKVLSKIWATMWPITSTRAKVNSSIRMFKAKGFKAINERDVLNILNNKELVCGITGILYDMI